MNKYLDSLNPSLCCGCSSCTEACPKHALEMKVNAEGFYYPVVNDNCVECGLCTKVCPWESSTDTQNTNPITIAAYDYVNRIGSTSGGIFYTIAKYIVQDKNGWVYGAAFDKDFQLSHIGADNLDSLQKLRGSKYLQSNTNVIYKEIKQLLLNGRYVFFVGTPCQVAGLHSFLKKDYETLLTADLVCHGVPSQKYFDEHISYLEKKNHDKVKEYYFRDLKGWGVCEEVLYATSGKRDKHYSYSLSPYLQSFMSSDNYRESCYQCKYAKLPRVGDLTLADYWGVRIFFPHLDYTKGCSLVLLNSDKGKTFWNGIKDRCVFEISNIQDASKYNHNINNTSKRPALRDTIYHELAEHGYESVVNKHYVVRHRAIKQVLHGIRNNHLVDKFIYFVRKNLDIRR